MRGAFFVGKIQEQLYYRLGLSTISIARRGASQNGEGSNLASFLRKIGSVRTSVASLRSAVADRSAYGTRYETKPVLLAPHRGKPCCPISRWVKRFCRNAKALLTICRWSSVSTSRKSMLPHRRGKRLCETQKPFRPSSMVAQTNLLPPRKSFSKRRCNLIWRDERNRTSRNFSTEIA